MSIFFNGMTIGVKLLHTAPSELPSLSVSKIPPVFFTVITISVNLPISLDNLTIITLDIILLEINVSVY